MSNAITTEKVYDWLQGVTDPEVPVLTVLDMGIIRDVQLDTDEKGSVTATVVITPTYSGCPAMDVIGMNIRMALLSRGITKVNIEQQLSPAWTTDWMSEEGKQKLKEYGIAPPERKSDDALDMFEDDSVACPRCGSEDTELVSRFGPTACKSLYRCLSCKEPFEHFKCH
ncbi:MAG: phenylacetate-CoA oxygenase subunit PaaJ [Chitinophagales bacterium]|nr:phenylacetate-CoA oxygenase subunit PaaJ [Chitinophagaceae bacterium]MCB9065503.1 phenylacetate-CoA oxygenase subunit PaaJ [Chitinophagales bacterium]